MITNEINKKPHGMMADVEQTQIRMSGRCRAFLNERKMDATFGLLTALELLGITTPWLRAAYSRWEKDRYLQIIADSRGMRYAEKHRYGVAYYTMNVPIHRVEVSPGIYCTDPVCTWFMMARFVSLDYLVALGDAILGPNNRLSELGLHYELEDFISYIEEVEQWTADPSHSRKRAPRGIGECRLAIELMRQRVESPQESIVRIDVLMKHGLPEPKINYVVNLENGHTARLDMAYPQWKIAIEYDGKQHEESWEEDNLRRNKLAELGWAIIVVTRADVATPEAQLACAYRIAARIEERTHEPMPVFADGYTTEELAMVVSGKPVRPRKWRRKRGMGKREVA